VIQVPKRNGRYIIEEEGETLISSADTEWVTLYVNEIVNFRLARHMSGFIKIHAACGSFEKKRFLLAGKKGAGKTTLITRLLFDGMDAHGDERVLVRGHEVIPLPRKFHLKEGTIPLITKLRPIWDKLTSYPISHGVRLCFFDPLNAGLRWQTKWGKVNAIFYLKPNHGNPTELEPCPKWLMSQNLIMVSLDFDTNPEYQIADLCQIVDESESFIVRVGELNGAVRSIKEILS
jgi:hypothetical protein